MISYSCLDKQRFDNGDYYIKPVQENDIEKIRLWRNNQMNILRQETKISAKQQRKYYKDNIWPKMGDIEPDIILVSLFLKEKMIGYGGLVNISWKHKRAEVSFLCSYKRLLNNQFYKEDFSNFLCLIKYISFSELGLNRLYSETYDIRNEHISILEANGFEKEGIWRKHAFIDYKYVDSLLHGCLNDTEPM
jgi:RimJ/RimL family protein N-acetyltransferase